MTTTRGTTSRWEALTMTMFVVAAIAGALGFIAGAATVVTAIGPRLSLPGFFVKALFLAIIASAILRAVWLKRTRDAARGNADAILSHPLMNSQHPLFYAAVVPILALSGYVSYGLNRGSHSVLLAAASLVLALIYPGYFVTWIVVTLHVRTQMRALRSTGPRPARGRSSQPELADLGWLTPTPEAPTTSDLESSQ